MNIQTVIANIDNTIQGKKTLLEQYMLHYDKRHGSLCPKETLGQQLALSATIKYLSINIGELKAIRDDLLKCKETK